LKILKNLFAIFIFVEPLLVDACCLLVDDLVEDEVVLGFAHWVGHKLEIFGEGG
jgi:hypothetical protein